MSKLFGYATKELNRNVRNNINRFPEDYCFQLTLVEFNNLRCKIVTSSYGGRRYNPYVFTEYGIVMLAGILKSDIAVSASINIVNAFISMRKYIANNNYDKRISNIESKLIEYDNKFDYILEQLEPKL